MSPDSPPPPRPANATRNPFTEEVTRPPKRSLESDEGANYRWGDVKQPGKRSRTGKLCESILSFIAKSLLRSADGPPGKPPAGYKCKICESPDVSTTPFCNNTVSSRVQPSTSSQIARIELSPRRATSARFATRSVCSLSVRVKLTSRVRDAAGPLRTRLSRQERSR